MSSASARLTLIGLLLLLLGCSAATAENVVNFPSADSDLHGRTPTRLRGVLLRPTGDGPFSAIVVLHDCNGLYQSGRVAPRYRQWTDDFVRRGYAVLAVDSQTPRDIHDGCTTTNTHVDEERARDAFGALAFMQRQPFVRANRIAAVGWTQGALSLLWALDEENGVRPANIAHRFAAAVAFSPDCGPVLEREPPWETRTPLAIFSDAVDGRFLAGSCLELVKWSRLNGEPVSITARPEASPRVPAFLARYLQP